MPTAKKAAGRKQASPAKTETLLPSTSATKDHSLPEGSSSALFVNSVEKAMRVLAAFDGKQPRLTLSQIASLTDLDLSAAQRFTHTLTTLGYLQKNLVSKTYELSPRLLNFSYQYLASSELVNRAAPYLRQLSQETEETTNVTVLDGTDIVFALRLVSRHVLNPHVIVGTRIPAYCTAPGLAILAHLPTDQAQAILAQSNLIAHTPHTVFDAGAILKRLETIRGQGYAHTEGEFFLGDISTAAAVLDAHGLPIGAINVAVSRIRWHGEKDEKRLAEMVMSAAAAVSGLQR